MERSSGNAGRNFAAIAIAIVALDVVTKFLAVQHLPPRIPQEVMGLDWFRLTLVYNRGAAFGIHLGHDVVTRLVFTTLTFVALFILWRLYRETRADDSFRMTAISLVAAGAVGNLIDRVRSSQGVVDFFDVGVGASRWPTFNIADMAISTGAVMLAIVLWREDAQAAREAKAATTPLSESSGDGRI